jgi:hypothetical protein
MANDTAAFAAHFSLKSDDPAVTDVTYRGDFDGLEDILSHDWDGKRFRPDQIQGLDCLTEFVA